VRLQIEGAAKQFGARRLFDGVAFEVRAGDRIGLVGPNGAGKTTLLRILAGDESPDDGRVHRSRDLRIGMLRQEIDPTLEHSVEAEVATVFARLDQLERQLGELERQISECGRAGREVPSELAARYDRARAAYELGGGFERDARIARVLAGLGFDAADRARPIRSFSGGWLMRVELAKLLLAEPDVLLLDEPTNHLDLPSIQWFEEMLATYRGGAVIISHDRTFLRRHATRIAELEAGRFRVYEGSFDRYLSERSAHREQLLARQRTQDRQIAQMERFVERFRAKATKARQVQSRIKALGKLERVEVERSSSRKIRLRIPKPARSGDVVMQLANVHKSYGETRVYHGIDLEVRRGDRLALVGPNGAGKSTLLRILAGALPIDSGDRTPGHNVEVAFYAQHQLESLDAAHTVLTELAHTARGEELPRLRGHLGAFLFSGDDVEKKISVLSGGEKARLALARMLLRPRNFLVLDEPTNHLDLAACEILEEALRSYAGTLAFISHDRTFINALATRVVEVRAGVLREFPGNYDAYLQELDGGARAGPAAGPGHGGPRAEPTPKRSDGAPGASAGTGGSRELRIAAREQQKERERARARAKKRLSSLEEEILAKEKALEALNFRQSDPAVYRDGEQMRAIEAERGETRAAIDVLYRDWERIAAELEVLEGVLHESGTGA
jgi:ATP-binding cassette subfamily F protein 3